MGKGYVSFIPAAVLAAAPLARYDGSGSSTEAPSSRGAGSQSQMQDMGGQDGSGSGTGGMLLGETTFWHSFIQGSKLETIQKVADELMEENPDVKINTETFSWNDFRIKWTIGLAFGSIPDISTALSVQVAEMINANVLTPINDPIDDTDRDKFVEAAMSEGAVGGNSYSVLFCRHAHVMWIRKGLLEKNGLEIPKTWGEFYDTAKILAKDGAYGLSFLCGTDDFQATSFLDFYVRSGGGSLLIDNLKASLTDDLVIDGISCWLKVYNSCSLRDSVNFDVLDQTTLYYQGKTVSDSNSNFQILGVATSSLDLPRYVDYYPIPEINADDLDEGIMTTNTPMVMWKASKYLEICKVLMRTLYDKDTYVEFLYATPVGILPAIKGIANTDTHKDNGTIRQFTYAEEVLTAAADIGTAFGYEHGPNVQADITQDNHVTEGMSRDIITNGTDVKTAAKIVKDKLDALFETVE